MSNCSLNMPGYENIVKMIRDKCNINNFPIQTHKDYKKVWQQAYQKGKNRPIEDHKDYKELMTKYAIKGQGECGYIPCLEITRHPKYNSEKNKWKKEWDSQDITSHPGYKKLMETYAIRGPQKIKNSEDKCGPSKIMSEYIPCSEIKRHPKYESEKKTWWEEWNKMPICKHPQYRKTVESLMNHIFSKLGSEAKGAIDANSWNMDAIGNFEGGCGCSGTRTPSEPDLNENFTPNIAVGSDPAVTHLYSEIIRGRTQPCPIPSIKQHPEYQKLVDNITNNVIKEWACNGKQCIGSKKCNEFIPVVIADERKKCDFRVDCCMKKCNRTKMEMEDKYRRSEAKLQTTCNDEKQKLKDMIKKYQDQIQCCQKQLEKCKQTPVTSHPDWLRSVKQEQLKLLEMIRREQNKCPKIVSYNLGQHGGKCPISPDLDDCEKKNNTV